MVYYTTGSYNRRFALKGPNVREPDGLDGRQEEMRNQQKRRKQRTFKKNKTHIPLETWVLLLSDSLGFLANKFQSQLVHLICLRQSRSSCLHQNIIASHFRRSLSDIGITNT